MELMDGNLRPLAALSRTKTSMLPSARIQCASGRIRVGDRTYLSASDALTAYLQQFDGKTPVTSVQQVSTSSPSSYPTSYSQHVPTSYCQKVPTSYSQHVPVSSAIDGFDHGTPFNHFNVSTSSQSYNPASVTKLLTGSPRGHERTGTSLIGSSHLAPHTYSTATLQDTVNVSSSHRGDYGTSTCGPSSAKVNGYQSDKNHFDFESRNRTGLDSVNGLGLSEGPQTVTPRACSEIETLLCSEPPKTFLSTPSSRRQMAQEAQDTLREVKLKRLLTESKNRNDGEEKKSSLQQEVEEALSRSAQLLETIKTDTLVNPRCVSDVGSLSTDVLLSVNPYNPGEAVTGGRQSRSRHRYSYHTPGHHHTRSLSLGRVPGAGTLPPSLRESGRRRSVDSLEPVGASLWKDKVPQDVYSSTASSISAMSDPSDIQKHLHNLFVSPYTLPGQGERSGNGGLSNRTGPPSWIQDLIPPTPTKVRNGFIASDAADSIFSKRGVNGGRPPPSWVNGMDQSDIASSVDTQDLRDAAEVLAVAGVKALTANGKELEVDDSVLTDLSYAGPGLNYSDLITSPAPNRHKVSFSSHAKPPTSNFHSRITDRSRNGGVLRNGNDVRGRRDGDRGKPPTGRIHQDLAGVDMVRPKPHNMSGSLSSSLGAADSSVRLRKKITEDSIEAKRSMDEYLACLTANGDDGDGGGGVGKTAAVFVSIPRCSSLDTLNVMDQRATVPFDVTGASPITRDSNFSSKLCLDDLTLTPAKQARTAELAKGATVSPDLDDLLDGDRPWENMAPSFKAPVHVGDSSPGKYQASAVRPVTPTLSGGQQPGSMEALKKMLFRLQTEETSGSSTLENGGAESLIPALADYNFEDEPGGQSLERALVHLGRLKTLVQTTGPGSKKDTD